MTVRDPGIGRRFSDDYEIPDLPEGDDGRPEDWPDPPVPGADDA